MRKSLFVKDAGEGQEESMIECACGSPVILNGFSGGDRKRKAKKGNEKGTAMMAPSKNESGLREVLIKKL